MGIWIRNSRLFLFIAEKKVVNDTNFYSECALHWVNYNAATINALIYFTFNTK